VPSSTPIWISTWEKIHIMLDCLIQRSDRWANACITGGFRNVVGVISIENELQDKLYVAGIAVIDTCSNTAQ
jgi:hypothetical protein